MSLRQTWPLAFGTIVAGLILLVSASLRAAPLLDAAFGVAGTARVVGPASYDDFPRAGVMQADGKLLVAGTREFGRDSEAFVMRFDTQGVPDPTFGQGGISLPPLGWGFFSYDHKWVPAQLEVLGDGSILVLGSAGIARLNAQGAVDMDFGTGGRHPADLNTIGFVAQPDGKILLLGLSQAGDPSGNKHLAMTRLTARGQLDTGFGDGGHKVFSGLLPALSDGLSGGYGSSGTPNRSGKIFQARGDGGFVLLARENPSQGFQFFGVTAHGELDPGFGYGGAVSGQNLGLAHQVPNAVAVAPDGGFWWYFRESTSAYLVRLTRDGRLDSSFAENGRRILDACCFPGAEVLLRAYPGGLALVGQGSDPQAAHFGGYLYDSNGVQIARLPAEAGTEMRVSSNVRHSSWGLFARPGGGVVVLLETVGHYFFQFMYAYPKRVDLALLAFDSSGRLEQGYGRGDGAAVWNGTTSSIDDIHSIVLEPGGEILLAGYTYSNERDFLVTRFDAAGTPDRGFAKDGRYVPDPNMYARWAGRARLARGSEGTLAVAAGVGYGSTGNVAAVNAFRLDNQGSLLGGFNPDLTDPESVGADVALAAGSNGRIYYSQGRTLERRLPDGSLDASFGNGGKITVPLPRIGTDPRVTNAALHVAADETIALAVGTRDGPWVFKFAASGALITGFGQGGVVSYANPWTSNSNSARVSLFGLPDGGLLLGYAGDIDWIGGRDKASHFLVLRIGADGQLNLNWNYAAVAEWRLAALPDGSVVITRDQALYRMFADGNFDFSFGPGGAFALPITAVNALGVDASGRLLVAGRDATGEVLQRYVLDASVKSVSVVEFFNSILGHYFVTGGTGEIAAIEAGAAGPGWQRTGLSFKAYAPETGIAPGAQPVCRFYGTPGRGPNSHFYTVDPIECELVKHDSGWTYEGTAFYLFPPTNGQCAAAQQAVYRAYNMRFAQNDSNHRYTTDAAVYAQTQAQGWAGEGVKFCGAP